MKHKKKSSTTPIKISVVVPVYQVEQFLPQCLNSILAQTLKELEIIVVDDGSPDNCGHIIDEYAKKDSRIIPIHQDNQGYGSAVNNGIKRAHGQYLAVVESDDFLEPEMYAKLYAKAEKYHADIAKCSFYNFNQDNQQKTISSEHPDQLFPCPNNAFCLRDYPKILMSHASIWSMIYRRSFWQKNHLSFLEGKNINYHDILLMTQAFSQASKIVVVKEPLYNWRYNRAGNSTDVSDERALIMPFMCQKVVDFLQEKDLLSFCAEEIYYNIVNANENFFSRLPWRFRLQYFDQLRQVFLPLLNIRTFHFKYFNYWQRQLVQALWHNDCLRAWKIYQRRLNLMIWRHSLFSKRLPADFDGYWQICILGLQIGTAFDYNLYSWAKIKIPSKK